MCMVTQDLGKYKGSHPEEVRRMMYAIGSGDLLGLESSVRGGQVDINSDTFDGRSGLGLAMQAEKGDAAALLLRSRADPNRRDGNGLTPIFYGLSNPESDTKYEMIKLILDAGADASARAPNGESAYEYAKRTSSRRIVELIEGAAARARAARDAAVGTAMERISAALGDISEELRSE